MSYYFSKTIEAAFAEAVTRTKAALAARGFGVLSEIDVAATLKAKLGAQMPPSFLARVIRSMLTAHFRLNPRLEPCCRAT